MIAGQIEFDGKGHVTQEALDRVMRMFRETFCIEARFDALFWKQASVERGSQGGFSVAISWIMIAEGTVESPRMNEDRLRQTRSLL